MITNERVHAHRPWLLASFVAIFAVLPICHALAADPASGGLAVEIKKHTTGKEATVRHGDIEWFIHIDVDDNRTMIIRTEADKGRETKNNSEIVERPMSNAEVDHIIADFISGIQSTIKP